MSPPTDVPTLFQGSPRLGLSQQLQSYMASAATYMRKGLSKATIKSYDSAWAHYSQFCSHFSVSTLPVNIPFLCAYIVHCHERRAMSASSINGQLAGIQFHLRCHDPSINMLRTPAIRLLLDGIKKGSVNQRDKRLPFTLPLLCDLITHLRRGHFGIYIDTLLEAVFFTAFYGFLRCGEFTSTSGDFNPSLDLTLGDLVMHETHFTIFLKHSKADRVGDGVSVCIARTDTPFCPCTSMSRYLKWRPHAKPDEPLFLTPEGRAMNRHWFAIRLRKICVQLNLPPDRYTPHSFRIGAATTASAVVSQGTLQKMGRWHSSAYTRYLRPDVSDVLAAQRSMESSK